MLGVAYGAVLEGITASPVRVEADVSQGLPYFSIVGLPDSAVQESKLRIRAALRNSGLPFPNSRITINLSPASMKKRGPGLDLAIAVAILNALGFLTRESLLQFGFCGELGLSGEIAPVIGVVNLALALQAHGLSAVVIAEGQVSGIVPIPGFEWLAAGTLLEVVDICRGHLRETVPSQASSFTPPGAESALPASPWPAVDISDVRGLSEVKRALLIAACGRHHTLLFGPPGCGKTMLAERFHTIMPPLTEEQALEVFAIHQACDVPRYLADLPPLRCPHHSVTRAGLVGGGMPPIPGEVTLAHRGVLLLDEMLEFERGALESLREPLSSQHVRLTRGGYRSVFPADFVLLGTLNPCPCGQHGFGNCTCLPTQIHRYWSSLSGPLMDRIELVIPVHPEKRRPPGRNQSAASVESGASETSHDVRRQAQSVQQSLRERVNALNGKWSRDVSSDAVQLLERAGTKIPLSTRGIQAVLRVARTVSVVDGDGTVHPRHIHEALAYRSLQKP